MKRIFFILVVVLITTSITAQVPQKMSYQAVIRDANDSLVRNQRVNVRISILKGDVNGTEVYKEVFDYETMTNMNGLLTIEIGSGQTIAGSFSGIDWSDGPYFLKTETDINGKSDYSLSSVSQLLSVPYALHAKTAEALADPAIQSYIDAVLARVEAVEEHLNILSPKGVFIDTRDSTQYKTIKIGEQTWMAENLKYLPEVSSIPEHLSGDKPQYYVLDYNGTNATEAKATENYNLYGVLYNWPAAINGATESNSNPSGVQGVCPAGWHLPSMNEWKQLVDYLGGEDVTAKKLMASGSNQWTNNTGATNESGFTALPGGALFDDWGTYFENGNAYWWTSTLIYSVNENGKLKFYFYPSINGYNSTFGFYDYQDAWDHYGSGLSVRCVKD